MTDAVGARRPAAPGRLAVRLAALGVAVAAIGAYHRDLWSQVDLAVYRRGAAAVLAGTPLYAPGPRLPFTYPPFAALLFTPLAKLPDTAAIAVLMVISLMCYAVMAAVCADRLGVSRRAAAQLAVAGLAFEPVMHTVGIGQINLVLGLLVVVDCLVLPRRWRGVLVGVAAGVKLTPGVFVFYFLLRRDRGAVVRCAAGFLGTVVVAWLADPADSRLYWTKLFFNPRHVGQIAYPFNQGLYGDLARITRSVPPSTWLYGALAAAALALAIAAARRQRDDVSALLCIAVGGLLISPISWTHHWIWLVPASWALLCARRWLSAAVVAAVPIVEPLRYVPTPKYLPQLHHTWWQALISLTYTAVGVWFLLAMTRGCAPSGRGLFHRRSAVPTK